MRTQIVFPFRVALTGGEPLQQFAVGLKPSDRSEAIRGLSV
jgi:organic radical activating enzyme